VSATEHLDNSAAGLLNTNVIVAFSQFESDQNSDRTKQAIAQKQRDGEWFGRPPYGFSLHDGRLVPDKDKLEVVRRIYEAYLQGHDGYKQLGYKQIVKVIKEEYKDEVLGRDAVRDILMNPIYAGKIAVGRRVVLPGRVGEPKHTAVRNAEDCELHDLTEEVEPVVSFKTWKRVQAKRQSSPSYRSSESGALFQGLLYCSHCHRLLCTHGSCKGKTKGKIKYACESTYGTRVKKVRGAEHSAGTTGPKYYCGKQLWEHYLEGPIVAALAAEAEGLEVRVTVEEDLEVARRRTAAAQRRLDIALHRAMTLEDITDEQANAGINGAKLQLAAYQERERQIEDEAEQVGRLKKLVKSSTTIEALYRDKLDKTRRQGFLHQFITRIDVGTSFLTVHWSFKEGKGTKIARSLVTPRRGIVTEDKYSIAASGSDEQADSIHRDTNSYNISSGLTKAIVPAMGKKCVDNAESKAYRCSDNEGKRVVEIGGIDNLGVQLDASFGLLLNLLPNLPADAERRPLKQRNARRGRKARA
jgi:hypothetical protein